MRGNIAVIVSIFVSIIQKLYFMLLNGRMEQDPVGTVVRLSWCRFDPRHS